MHQTVNLRGRGLPIVFGDPDSKAKYELEVIAAVRNQRVRFAVAPRVSVRTPTGKVLNTGEEVSIALLHGGTTNAWQILNGWLQSGHVIEADDVSEGT